MKLQTVTIFAALSLVVGCNRSDTERAAADNRDATAVNRVEANRTETTNLAPTSRNIDSPSRTYPNGAKDVDNTGNNVRDRGDATLTPGDQGNSESDRVITRNIRQALMKNDELSTTAKNIKIITVNGKVTLRGPVTNEKEQQAIATAAQAVAGVNALDNQLEVKAK